MKMEIKPENLLSVRVGRVVSREVDTSSFVSPEEYNQYFSDGSLFDLCLPKHYKDKWSLVPTQYFMIYLGEVFSFYLTCTNDSIQEIMSNVSIRIDMQTGNRAIFLKEFNVQALDAKANIDAILSYEIKEAFAHVLIFTMSFDLAGYERQTCRKYFQFQVAKPIDVKTKSYYAEQDEIVLEVLFQNLTNLPMQLKSVMLDSNDFDVVALNYLMNDLSQQWIFGDSNRLNSTESRQYLFLLSPKADIRAKPAMINSVSAIGKLDIVWVSGIGEKGHIQTSQLERTTTNGEYVRIFVEQIPSKVYSRTIFKAKLRIINCSSKIVEPTLKFINSENENIFWLGTTSKILGQLQEFQSTEIEMKLFPIKSGLQNIPLVRVTDLITNENYDFKNLASVCVI